MNKESNKNKMKKTCSVIGIPFVIFHLNLQCVPTAMKHLLLIIVIVKNLS